MMEQHAMHFAGNSPVRLNLDYFCLDQICRSGQCFRMEESGEGAFTLTALGRQLFLRQNGKEVCFDCTEEEFDGIWREYFDLNADYGRIIDAIDDNDCYLKKAAAFGSGIRILKQDLWETLISFIISQQNNIKRIRRCIALLCEKYGEAKQSKDGSFFYDFPGPEQLAEASLADLYACNLGYRSRYIKETAAAVREGTVNLEQIRAMNYEQAREELKKLSGVGNKVADCVCLFALHYIDAFPVDTHIGKVLARQYPQGFPAEKYAGYGGILQQYIFFYDLTQGNSAVDKSEERATIKCK